MGARSIGLRPQLRGSKLGDWLASPLDGDRFALGYVIEELGPICLGILECDRPHRCLLPQLIVTTP
jgi:hypothetical protein